MLSQLEFRRRVESIAVDQVLGMITYPSAQQVLEDIVPDYADLGPVRTRAIHDGYKLSRQLGVDKGGSFVGGQVPDALLEVSETPLWQWCLEHPASELEQVATAAAELVVALAFERFETHLGPTVRDMMKLEADANLAADRIFDRISRWIRP